MGKMHMCKMLPFLVMNFDP